MSEQLQYVKGLDELARRLNALPLDLARKSLRKATSAGAAIIRDAARAAAPIASAPHRRKGRVVPPGTLKRSAIIKFVRALSNDTQVDYIVTFRKGPRAAKSDRDAFYASWVEFGHRIVPRAGKGQLLGRRISQRRRASTGRVPPHRYFGPAFDASKYRALQTIQDVLAAEIAKAENVGSV